MSQSERDWPEGGTAAWARSRVPSVLVKPPERSSHVAIGSTADVRLTAFKSRLTPVVPGRVVYVSADRLVERTSGTPYYTVHVDVAPEELQKAGNLRLQAGMPVEVLIKTAERTALQYLLDPVTAFVGRSLREP